MYIHAYRLKKVQTTTDRSSLHISSYDHMLKGILCTCIHTAQGILYYVPYATTLCFMQGNTCVVPVCIVPRLAKTKLHLTLSLTCAEHHTHSRLCQCYSVPVQHDQEQIH